MTSTTDLPKRIEVALACLPDAPYKEMLRALFADMTAERDEYAKAADSMSAAHKVERDALAERVKALEADAGRYWWLIENCGFSEKLNGCTELNVFFHTLTPSSICEIDAAIDAAIKAILDMDAKIKEVKP